MKLITFTYTKDAGKISERMLLELSGPETMHKGIDISELCAADQVRFTQEYLTLQKEFLAKTSALMKEFDVAHNFRQFKPEKMSNVEVEKL